MKTELLLYSSNILRVYGFLLCSIPLWFAFMFMRVPSSPRSIAGVTLGRALAGYPITAHHLYSFVLYLHN